MEVDAAELFMVDFNQTELFHWLKVDVGRPTSTVDPDDAVDVHYY